VPKQKLAATGIEIAQGRNRDECTKKGGSYIPPDNHPRHRIRLAADRLNPGACAINKRCYE